MGGACSTVQKERTEDVAESKRLKKRFNTVRSFRMRKKGKVSDPYLTSPVKNDSADLRLSFSSDLSASTTPRKSIDGRRSSFFGKAGLERAVEVLDALGSGFANLNSTGFISGLTMRGNKISILAFEVANTITRGASLMHSLSDQNVHHVKNKVFFSDGVQHLVSTNTNELLRIAAADKREELGIFCCEVARFGNLCKDPQWHHLERLFAKLDSENAAYKLQKEEGERKMHELTILAQHTAELYHELNAFDRYQKDYQQRREEVESYSLSCKGESLVILQTELKHQKRLVMSLKRKSLWSKLMEEVIEKLVDIVAIIHQKINEVYANTDIVETDNDPSTSPERLGVSGLALHYASIINQINNIAFRPSCLPPNTRDLLYRGLPASVKNALGSSLKRTDSDQQLPVPQIKAEMEMILVWLVPAAASTSKMYQGFGWVGEWAHTSNDSRKQGAATGNLIRLQTLYHADKQKTDFHILQLVKLLHHLISATKQRDYEVARSLPVRTASLGSVMSKCPSVGGRKSMKTEFSEEERNLLERMKKTQSLPIASKSQEFYRFPWRRREFSRRETELVDNGCDFAVLNRLDLAF